MRILQGIFGTIAVLSVIYSVIMVLYAGWGTSFLKFWLALALGSAVLALWFGHLYHHHQNIPKGIFVILITIVAIGILAFGGLEVLICRASVQKPENQPQVILVLGAQIRGTRITRSLKYRLNATVDYWNEIQAEQGTTGSTGASQSQPLIIVSGGQGPGEDVTEAKAMKEYLVSAGVPEKQILCENQSTNTVENFRFSKEIIQEQFAGEPSANVAIITNGFHLYRAMRIAKNQGLEAEGLGAKTDQILGLNYYVREAFAVAKDFAFGNITLY